MAEVQKRLKVIIVGGSVAGLTLAHGLHANDIDYVVLEGSSSDMAPHIGASIVVYPSGLRILDQLGIADDVLAVVDPLERGYIWKGSGQLIVDTDAGNLTKKRMGYPFAFLLRSDLLKIMSDHLPDQTKFHTSKRVVGIDHSEKGVVVHCKDGSSFSGDIVVGADGIRSTVRSLMQQHMKVTQPDVPVLDSDDKNISSEFSCIFGFSDNIYNDDLVPGASHRSYSKDYSTLSFVGSNGRVFWFMYSKYDKRYYGKDIPRFGQEDCVDHFKHFNDLYMTATIKYSLLFENRTFANMLSLEEMQISHWTSDRFVCIGDSVHKMTPNLGAGGNSAMESAVSLANNLAKLPRTDPSLAEIQQSLKNFQTHRELRANLICDEANKMTRLETLSTLPEKLVAFYGLPAAGDYLTDTTCSAIVGAEKLDCLPIPLRSLEGTMPYDQGQGIGMQESRLVRALWALPLLGVLFAATKTIGPVSQNVIPAVAATLEKSGGIILESGEVAPVLARYIGVKGVDAVLRLYAAVFSPMIGNLDAASHAQGLLLLADLIPVQAIWTVESFRRGNFVTVANLLPTLLGIGYQIKGIGYIAPLFYFLHYVQSPLENYAAADNRMCQMDAVKTIIPTLALSYVAPTLAMFTWPGLANRQWINAVLWQPFPIYTNIIHRVFRKCVKDTTQEDREKNPEADMVHLRRIYGAAAGAAFLTYCYVRIRSPVSILDAVFSGIKSPSLSLGLVKDIAKFLQYDQLCAFSAGAIWTMLSFKDLKKAKKIDASWGRILGVFAGTTIVGGPGAAMATMWAWREECLPSKRLPQRLNK